MEEKKDSHHDHDIIDEDLYEEFTDEELVELVEKARTDAHQKAAERKIGLKKPPSKLFKWFLWCVAAVLVFNVFALLPQTFSIPAVKFLTTSAKLSAQANVKDYKQAVVVIETEDGGKGTGLSYTEDGTILTNHHVIEGHEQVTVAYPKEGLFIGTVVESFPDIDLAILQVKTFKDLPKLELADSYTLEPDEEVYFVGNPLQFTGIANKGNIINYTYVKDIEIPVVMMDAPVYRGNSGSPVINEEGLVVGIIFATLFDEEEDRVGLFIPIEHFHENMPEKNLQSSANLLPHKVGDDGQITSSFVQLHKFL